MLEVRKLQEISCLILIVFLDDRIGKLTVRVRIHKGIGWNYRNLEHCFRKLFKMSISIASTHSVYLKVVFNNADTED